MADIESSPADVRIERLLHRFALAAQAHHVALEDMDAERAEAKAEILAGIYGTLAGSGEQGMEKLLRLTDSSDPVVAGMAAVYSMRRNSSHCLATLRRLAAEPGLLGFRAGMAIERWESGEWSG